jgi:DNA polymerase-1
MRVLEPVQAAWEISAQTVRCLEIMDALQIPVYAAPGYEADDVMGALSVQAAEAGIDTFLVTLDSDIVQLIRPNVRVYMLRPYQRDKVIYDEASARERYGFDPRRMADFKALRGDVSDNIPGVPGIGDTTAKKLLGQFGSIDSIYEHIDEVTPEKTRRLLREYEGQVRHAVDLATIRTDLPGVALDLDSARVGRYDRQRVLELFRDLEFRSLVPRLPPVEASPAPAAAAGEAPTAAGERYHLVASAEEMESMVAALRAAGGFAWDLEVSRSGAFDHVIAGLSFAGREGEAYYVPVGPQLRLDDAPPLAIETVIERLAPLLADRALGKTAHNGKFDVRLLLERGLEVEGFEFDTLIAAYLLGEGGGAEAGRGAGSLNLKWLVSRRLGLEMKEVSELLGTGARQLGIDQVRPADALPYVCANVDMTLRLRAPLEKELRDQGMWELFREMEMPLIPVLARMEAVGIALGIPVLREMARGMDDQIRYLEERAYAEVGHEFNLGSPLQLSQVLFEELSLPKTRRTKQGYSTDAQAIEALRGVHPVIDILLEWRQLTKLKSTYIDTLPGLVNPRTGRIHTTFNQAVAATGRLSSNDPNLQNIPVRSELGGQVRRAFVARDIGEDPYLLSADYSQIELRILAHLSQDPGLLEAFRLDEDIHAATASQVFSVPIEAVTREQRSRAKVFNFGVLYGLTDFGLATRERISREEASEFIRRYFEKYAAV